MKTAKIGVLGAVLLIFSGIRGEQPSLQVHAAKEPAKVQLLLGTVGVGGKAFDALVDVVKNDLMFTGSFAVQREQFECSPSKKEIKNESQKGYLFALFINENVKDNAFEWRLYDVRKAKMIRGKKSVQKGDDPIGWAHHIADAVWPILTGQEGFFSTKIAYCTHQTLKGGKTVQHLNIADYDGRRAQMLVKTPSVTMAPRWNRDLKKPLLFYSIYTNENVRLMVINQDKKVHIASNFDGINMLPTFSADGKKLVYCVSRGNGNCQLYYCERGHFDRLTQNDGSNVSPTLTDDGSRIYFCSDYQTGRPQIYVMNMASKEIKRLTSQGYCASPRYCHKTQKLAYGKIVNGVMQLFVYDEKVGSHEQLTFDYSNKEEPCWSPDGSYLMFSVAHGKTSRIAMMNVKSKKRHYITKPNHVCCYPDWSPVYDVYPTYKTVA